MLLLLKPAENACVSQLSRACLGKTIVAFSTIYNHGPKLRERIFRTASAVDHAKASVCLALQTLAVYLRLAVDALALDRFARRPRAAYPVIAPAPIRLLETRHMALVCVHDCPISSDARLPVVNDSGRTDRRRLCCAHRGLRSVGQQQPVGGRITDWSVADLDNDVSDVERISASGSAHDKPSQAKPSQAKPSQAKSCFTF